MDEINRKKLTHSQEKHDYQSENIQSTLKHDSSKDTYKITDKPSDKNSPLYSILGNKISAETQILWLIASLLNTPLGNQIGASQIGLLKAGLA